MYCIWFIVADCVGIQITDESDTLAQRLTFLPTETQAMHTNACVMYHHFSFSPKKKNRLKAFAFRANFWVRDDVICFLVEFTSSHSTYWYSSLTFERTLNWNLLKLSFCLLATSAWIPTSFRLCAFFSSLFRRQTYPIESKQYQTVHFTFHKRNRAM